MRGREGEQVGLGYGSRANGGSLNRASSQGEKEEERAKRMLQIWVADMRCENENRGRKLHIDKTKGGTL